jgi:Fe2+ transport system protein FeoA
MTNTRASSQTLPLSLAAPGETVTLVEIRLGSVEKQRLQELGLIPGASVRIIKSDPAFGLIVSVCRDGRLALNHGTARKLFVCLER